MTSTIAFAFLPSRIGAGLVGSLGVLGAVLAMVGLYGAFAFFLLQPLTALLVAALPARDPISFAASAGLLLTTSLLASWNPARRATRIQPGVALRLE